MFVLLATQTIFKRNEECKNQTRKCIWCRIAKSLFERTFLFTLVHLRQNCNFIQHAFCIMLSAININLGNHNIWLRMQSCDEKEVFFKAFIYLVFTKLWNVLIQSTHVHMVLKSEAFSIFIESADFRYCNITCFLNGKISMNINAFIHIHQNRNIIDIGVGFYAKHFHTSYQLVSGCIT